MLAPWRAEFSVRQFVGYAASRLGLFISAVPISFKRHRFPPEIIRHAIWLYARFTLSFRDIEELLAERGIDAS